MKVWTDKRDPRYLERYDTDGAWRVRNHRWLHFVAAYWEVAEFSSGAWWEACS